MTDLKYLDAEELRARLAARDTADIIDEEESDEKGAIVVDMRKLLGEHEAVRKYGLADISDEDIEKASDGDELDGFELPFTISTETVDRDNDTIRVNGWKLTDYRRNPVVLWAHNPAEVPVARSAKTFIDRPRKALRSVTAFPSAELHPFGNMVGRLFKHRFMNATSVGFRSLKAEINDEREGPFPIDFMQQELLEFSAVPIPANPEALVEARGIGIDTAPLAKWAEQILDGERDFVIVHRSTVENVWKNATGARPALVDLFGAKLAVTSAEPAPAEVDAITSLEPKSADTLHDDVEAAYVDGDTVNGEGADGVDTEDGVVQSGLTVTEARSLIQQLVADFVVGIKGKSHD